VPILVRSATQNDLGCLEGIENAADSLLIEWLDPGEWGQAASGRSRAALPGFILVSSERVDGAVVGFAHVIEADGFAHLEQLSVTPGRGRRGHGRALVEAAKAEAGDRGHTWMTLRTFAEVPWNAPFYATCGFIESEPATEFHRRLLHTELDLHLPRAGRRVEMTAPIHSRTQGQIPGRGEPS
jgi:GNAT superfamily N-acetyltransferase